MPAHLLAHPGSGRLGLAQSLGLGVARVRLRLLSAICCAVCSVLCAVARSCSNDKQQANQGSISQSPTVLQQPWRLAALQSHCALQQLLELLNELLFFEWLPQERLSDYKT